MHLQKLVLIFYKMKKLSYLLLFIILISCSKNKEIKENPLFLVTWSIIENNIDNEKVDQIKVLLNDEENKDTKNEGIVKTEEKPNLTPTLNENTETWVLTEEELNIIENTTDWEIDELIDILFKDL